MHENYLVRTSQETEPKTAIFERTNSQLYKIAAAEQFSGIFQVEDDTPYIRSQRMYNWAKNADMEASLKEATDGNGEASEVSAELLRLGFMMPYAIYSQHRKETGQEVSQEGLLLPNVMLREAIQAHPDLNPTDLANYIQGAGMWAGLPEKRKNDTARIISDEVNRARSVLNFEMILQSEAMISTGIEYETANPDEAMRGIDGHVTVPCKSKEGKIPVDMPVHIISSRTELVELNRSTGPNVYAMDGDVVVLWSGIDLSAEGLRTKLLIDQMMAEKKAEPMTKVLCIVAPDYHRRDPRGRYRSLGSRATRFAS